MTLRFPISPARAGAALCALLLAACSGMPRITFEQAGRDDDEPAQPWQEQQAALPAAPQAADLAGFYVSPLTPLSFAVDTRSLAVDGDGVVRYTLVAASRGGASNVSREGIHCRSGELKLYAVGRADGTWAPARNAQWQPVSRGEAVNPQAVLAKDFFCAGRSVDGAAADIVRRLRAGRPLGANG